jgi:hypothetical protein
MATPPPRPPSRRPTPGSRPGQPAPARPGAPGRETPAKPGTRGAAAGAPGARTGSRKAERIRYTPAKIEESKWGRKAVIGLVAVAVVVGTIGWYRYLTRPPVVVRLPVAAPAADAPDRAPAPAAVAAAPATPAPVERGPVTLLPRELAAELAVERELSPAQAFATRYLNREVTWSGTVTGTMRLDHVLKVDITDSDGMKLAAWCETDAEISPGVVVTVRGRLANRLRDGFSVDRCQIL